jgi:hypothetical protein
MKDIADDYMKEMLARSKGYTLLILRPGPRRHEPGADKIIWEHGRRNFALRAEGILSIVCPVGADEVAGIGIFNASVEDTERLMKDDPAVREGVLVFSVYACRSFPGDALPGGATVGA